MAWSGTTVVAKESKVTCKGKKKKAKLTDYRLEGKGGVFLLDFSIAPSKIKRGVFGEDRLAGQIRNDTSSSTKDASSYQTFYFK